MDFYVYLHRKATTGEIFYVGKGRKHRANEKGKRRSAHWNRVVAKHGLEVQFAATNLSEEHAFEIEQLLIEMLGRQDTGTGALINKTDGGEGSSGATYVMSEERKANIAKAKSGKKASVETRTKMSAAQKGRKHSAETKQKISKGQGGRAPSSYGLRPKVAVVMGEQLLFAGSKPAEDFLQAKGFSNADKSNIVKCCRGKIKSTCGALWRYAAPEEAAALKEKGASWAPLSDLRSMV